MPGSPGAQPLLLASASQRRRELLALLGVPFEAVATEVEELTEGDPAELVVANALRKARAGRELVAAGDGVSDGSGRIVIGVDTDVGLMDAVVLALEIHRLVRVLKGLEHGLHTLDVLAQARAWSACPGGGVAALDMPFDLGAQAELEAPAGQVL